MVCERDGEGADRRGGEAWCEHVRGERHGRQSEIVDHDEVGWVALGNGDRGGVRDRDGAPTVNSYKRFEVGSFAPASATWGGDNRTVAIRSLIETPNATRIELRAGAADAQPHWAVAALLAAVIAGLESAADPGDAARATCTRQGRRCHARWPTGSPPHARTVRGRGYRVPF